MTKEDTDCIVNAANNLLAHIDGLAGKIIEVGGKSIQKECDDYLKKHGKLQEGDVYTSDAGKLPCKKVIHAVGPYWRGGKTFEQEILALTVNNCLQEASNNGFSSISIPAISSGIFGFPKDKCAKILFDVSLNFFDENPKGSLTEIRFVNFDDKTVEIFEDEFITRFGGKKEKGESKKEEKLVYSENLSEEDMIKLAMQESIQETTVREEKSTLKKEFKNNNQVVQLRIGDITEEDTDAIVNAANSRLDHSAGVAGAIVNKGGYSIQKECNDFIQKNGPLKDSECYVSDGGSLKCKKIIHTIGPIWNLGNSNEDSLLVLSILNSLEAANEHKLTSVTFPAISTGKFGFPKDLCASLVFEASDYYFKNNSNSSVKEIRFTVYDDDTLNVFSKYFDVKFKDGNSYKNFDDVIKRANSIKSSLSNNNDEEKEKERIRLLRLQKFQ